MSNHERLHFACIRVLKDDQLYTPATIGILSRKLGLFDENPKFRAERLKIQRVRICLERLCKLAAFPDEGDGWVSIREQTPTPGWYGIRWKQLLP